MAPTATTDRPPDPPPNKLFAALEVRAISERVSMELMQPLLRQLPRGDGHSVLFLPGFTTDDRSTRPMRNLFHHLGYHTHRWRLGRNKGPTPRIADGLERLVERVIRRSDGPVSIVGWSLGGVYARELARRHSDDIRQVITLGSPLRATRGHRSNASLLWEHYAPRHVDFARFDVPESERPPLQMPATSIFTRTDGVVNWHECLADPSASSENVEVWGSHSGLGFNATALYVIADRLAQPVGDWERFRVPLHLKACFPPQCIDECRDRHR